MSHEKLMWMKDALISVVETELCNLSEVDTKELGEAIDMIKDLEEAIYYCTVTEAMNKQGKEMHMEMKKGDHHEGDRMYYSGYPMYYADSGMPNSGNGTSSRNYYDNSTRHDERDGHSYASRRMYMEAKEMNKDKSIQLRELERYMSELASDITEMIADSSTEEKQYLEKKITALASKIGSMK